jgi:hypothetical protein
LEIKVESLIIDVGTQYGDLDESKC